MEPESSPPRITPEQDPEHEVTFDEDLVDQFFSHITETASGFLDFSHQVREYKETMEETVRKLTLEMEEKEEECDFKQSLEAKFLILVLELQTKEAVTQLQDSMAKKHEKLKREFQVREEKLVAREEEVRLVDETIKEKSRELEKREDDVEAKRKSLELKEKELEEREELLQCKEKELAEGSKQAEKRKRSRDEYETTLFAEQQDSYDDDPPLIHSEVVCIDDEADEDPEPYNCLDADFNSFNNTMSSFSVGQVWALYDPLDHMPRFYARIRKVLELQKRLEVIWLEPKQAVENKKPIACGEFKYGAKTITSHLMFSHEMSSGKKGITTVINPRKGETWALFRDWTRPYSYDFVRVVSELDSDHGIGVAYLGRVEGFTSVYKLAEKNRVLQRMIGCDEMLMFSHRIPSFVLSGDEKEGVPAGSFELDPAAIPRDYLEDFSTLVKQEEEGVDQRLGLSLTQL